MFEQLSLFVRLCVMAKMRGPSGRQKLAWQRLHKHPFKSKAKVRVVSSKNLGILVLSIAPSQLPY